MRSSSSLLHPQGAEKHQETFLTNSRLLTELHINASPSGEVHLLLFSEQPFSPALDPFFAELKGISPEVIGLTGFAGQKKNCCPRQEPAHS